MAFSRFKGLKNRSASAATLACRRCTSPTDFFGYTGQANLYQKFRPTYPDALLSTLGSAVTDKKLALDIGCGSGQLTNALSETVKFANVIGVDSSAEQISKASGPENVSYHVKDVKSDENSLMSLVGSDSCDVVTIAQALHWFMQDPPDKNSRGPADQADMVALFKKVESVLKPEKGVFAVIGYGTPTFEEYPKFQKMFNNYYYNILGSYNFEMEITPNNKVCAPCYWEIDRKLVDFGFDDTNFEAYFDDIQKVWFYQDKPMPEETLFGYFRSWSGYNTLRNQCGDSFVDPLDELLPVFRQELKRTNAKSMNVVVPYFLVMMTRKSN